ncbi:polysaccharide biosynthesis protein [Prevotella sp. E13-27]|uniref:polysaccharide biosynthesis protein n=1 Tax=Prevotella sp. E13-27 TaxID=2938122 RepID=UPI00200A18DD|nr:nucleoside-diphosphate sugar epimerase/dehydratase [Prevotella sp. E13-27]MCK8622086.1 polysaccharide biosynthesis protein [Prevotella sp. E13-27]
MGVTNRLANWYFTKKALPYWCILIMDIVIVYLSYLFTYLQFRSLTELLGDFQMISFNAMIYMIFYIIGFRIMRTYSGIFRYSSFVDLQRVGYAMGFGMVVAYLLHYVFAYNEYVIETFGTVNLFTHLRGREILVASVLSTLVMWGVRMFVKAMYDLFYANVHAMRTYIYGVKNGGIGIAKNIRAEKPTRFLLRGFITDDPDFRDYVLMGVKVYRLNEDIVTQMKENHIEAIIISPLRLRAFRKNIELQNQLIEAGIKIYMTQEEREWGEDTLDKPQLKEISIEDLLPRDEIEVDMMAVGKLLTGKCIMITGSAGSIGSEMVRQIAIYNPAELVLVDQAETPQHDILLMMQKDYPDIKAEVVVCSICEENHMDYLFQKFRPQYVFHAAAYKHVPMMEDNPSESITNNVLGTKVIADLSVKYGVKKFVMVSTDKAVNPTNVMGCSKRICEIYVQSLNNKLSAEAAAAGKANEHCQFVTTRFGNVLGSNGSVIPLFQEQIKKGGPITVTHPDIIRFFMLIPEACKLVLEAGTKGNGGEIFVFDMGEPVKIADLAKRMISLSGMKNVKIEFTGLRPGEKLYEEVLNEQESTKPSFHEKIRIATVREYDYNEVNAAINELGRVALSYDNMETVKLMKTLVPEYKSNNSVYSVLDK